MNAPRVIDNDRDEITVTFDGKEIRGWSYADEAERRVKMRMAREFVEGWLQASERGAAPEMAEALRAIIGAQTDLLHVGYDDAPGGGNYVYADVIRTDNPAFDLARAALQKAGG